MILRFPFPNTPAFHHHLSLLHLFTIAKPPIIAASPMVAVKGWQVESVEVFLKSKDLPSALLADDMAGGCPVKGFHILNHNMDPLCAELLYILVL
jgi:hypothetical protein